MSKKVHWSLIVVASISGIALGTWFGLRPWVKKQEQSTYVEQSRDELDVARAEHKQLLEQHAATKTPLGQEAIARDRGYKKPEEQPWEPPK